MKSNASKKASKLRNERNRTGNFPVTTESLDELQKRIIGCIGLEYVEGSGECADSMPEEEVHVHIFWFALYKVNLVNIWIILFHCTTLFFLL